LIVISNKSRISKGDEKMNQFDLIERQQILGLALDATFKKRDEIQQKVNELISDIEDCTKTIKKIRNWQDELKDEFKEII
jgi:uncharacterized coiled-coil DUF342 family protein